MDIGLSASAFSNLHSVFILGVLLLCSLICLALIAERWFYFRKVKANPQKEVGKIKSHILAGKMQDALEILGDPEGNPFMQLIELALKNHNIPRQELTEVLRVFQLRQRAMFERSLGVLGTLGNTAPFIGLLGTVMGIIQAFRDLAGPQAQANGASVVATGISEALIATAAGLFVAIPAVIFYNYYLKKVKLLMTEMEASAAEVAVLITLGRQGNAV